METPKPNSFFYNKTILTNNKMQKTADSVWGSCLNFVEDNIHNQAFKTWFDPIKPLKLNGDALSVEVPSKFFYEWLEEHYIEILKVALTRELGPSARLVYVIRMENTLSNKQAFTESIPSQNKGRIKVQNVEAPLQAQTAELKNPCLLYTSPSPRDTRRSRMPSSA